MLTTDAKTAKKETAVKDIVSLLKEHFTSYRNAGKVIGTSHTRLTNLRNGQQTEFIALLEKIRVELGIKESEFWPVMLGDKDILAAVKKRLSRVKNK